MSIDVAARLQRGDFILNVEFQAEVGETVAILGPNGSGKSSLLRAISGLLPISAGTITIDGKVVDDHYRQIFVRPEKRGLGVVFQDGALFEHLTVIANVEFGLRSRGMKSASARAAATILAEQFDIGEFAHRHPASLSGGQRQRVAIARALATSPTVLLLDEPTSALDASSKIEVRQLLRSILEKFEGTRVLVTHDPADAHSLADRIIVLEDGRITQSGTISEVTANPRSAYVANLAGTNLISAMSDGDLLRTSEGTVIVASERVSAGEALVAILPSAVAIHAQEPHGSPRNVWRASVKSVDEFAGRLRVHAIGELDLVAEITPAAGAELAIAVGNEYFFSVKATEVHAESR